MAPYVWVGLQVTGDPKEQMSGSGQVECAHRWRNVTPESPVPCILATIQTRRAGACALVCIKCTEARISATAQILFDMTCERARERVSGLTCANAFPQ